MLKETPAQQKLCVTHTVLTQPFKHISPECESKSWYKVKKCHCLYRSEDQTITFSFVPTFFFGDKLFVVIRGLYFGGSFTDFILVNHSSLKNFLIN